MPTFGAWETTVLELAGDSIDHISLHAYYDPAAYETVDDYLSCSVDLDSMIERVGAIVDADRASHPGRRRIGLSVDEWNVWHLAEHREREAARVVRGFEAARVVRGFSARRPWPRTRTTWPTRWSSAAS